MPDYSEYIIKEDNEIKIFANYRGDYTFMADVFLGPILIKEFIQRQVEREDSKGDNAFSAIVLDYDKKDLLIEISPNEDSDGSGVFTIEMLLKLLEVRYPKWNIKYAHNGTLDRQKYLSTIDKPLSLVDYSKEGWDEPRGTLVSIDSGSNQTVYWNEMSIYEIIPKGAKYVLNSNNHISIPQSRFPFGGIHVDNTINKMYFWYFNPTPLAEDWARQYWLDINISFKSLGYRTQFDLIGQSVLCEVINSARKTAIERIKDSVVYSYQKLSHFRKENDRYDDELVIHSTQERLDFFEEALAEINKNSSQQHVKKH